MDGGAWSAAVRGVAKSRTRLSDCTFTFHFHALEKEMALTTTFDKMNLFPKLLQKEYGGVYVEYPLIS